VGTGGASTNGTLDGAGNGVNICGISIGGGAINVLVTSIGIWVCVSPTINDSR